MAVYRVTNAFHSVTGIVADDVMTTYHYSTNEAVATSAIGSAIAGHISAAWEAITAPGTGNPSKWISGEISRVNKPTLKAYDVGGGSPLSVDTWAIFSGPNGGAGFPGEVACCLSYNGDLTNVPEEAPDDADPDLRPERPASRRRGRIYIGPLQQQAGDSSAPARPGTLFRDDMLGLGRKLGTITQPPLVAVNTQWVVRSEASPLAMNTIINRVSVDNAFDTQRRRGVKPSIRTFQAVP